MSFGVWLVALNFVLIPHFALANTVSVADADVLREALIGASVRGGAYGAIVDRNLVICEWRHRGGPRVGLSFGGDGTVTTEFDRPGIENGAEADVEVRASRMTNNVILHCPDEPGIYINRTQDSLLANHTIFNAFGIQARSPGTLIETADNLLSGAIWQRDGARADKMNDLETGLLTAASYLPAIKRQVILNPPPHSLIHSEWLDPIIRWGQVALLTFLDWLADSRIGKGLVPFGRWFVAPQAGDFRLLAGNPILDAGTVPPRIGYDFYGRPRSAPSDIGAFEHRHGHCDLRVEMDRRYGALLVDLNDRPSVAPPDWSASDPMLTPKALREPTRIVKADPGTLRRIVSDLRPGDWLQLEPGLYSLPLTLHHLQGTAEHPIVISGPAEGEPAVFRGRPRTNTVSLIDAAHIVIRHITLDGRQPEISAVVAEGHGNYVHDITIENLRIRNYDRSRGDAGISVRVPAWNWVIRNNDIQFVGTGMYLGRPDGTAPFIGGLIENNFIAHTLGYNLQIKHQRFRDRLPHIPTEPRQTIIRYNVFSKASGSSGTGSARPNVLVGHWPQDGPGQFDRYLIYGNLFHENPHHHLFQGEGNVAFYNNLLVNHRGDGVQVFPLNHLPKNIHILQNTIVAKGIGIRIQRADPAYEQVVSGNAVFAAEPLKLPRRIDGSDNFAAAYGAASRYLINPDGGLADLDLFPRNRLLEKSDPVPGDEGFADLEVDYNGRPRMNHYWGAYVGGTPGNPGRKAALGPPAVDCRPCRNATNPGEPLYPDTEMQRSPDSPQQMSWMLAAPKKVMPTASFRYSQPTIRLGESHAL